MGTPHVIRPEGGRATRQLLALFDSHVRDLYSFLFRRCGNAALAEDLTQEVFVEAARRSHVSVEVPTRAWLYQFARHRLIDHWRRESRGSIKRHIAG
jgi:RNA polymerase sigma-70 factor (ECF subfamily)